MGLRSTLDNLEPHFKPGGRYETWSALYEAVDTIFYSPNPVTRPTAHVRDGVDLKRIMITVWMATFPAMFFGMWNLGFQANDAMAGMGIDALGGQLLRRDSRGQSLDSLCAPAIKPRFKRLVSQFCPAIPYKPHFAIAALWPRGGANSAAALGPAEAMSPGTGRGRSRRGAHVPGAIAADRAIF